MKPAGIVFDFDGLLADTEGWQWESWAGVLRPLGLKLTKNEYFDYAGKAGAIIERKLSERHGLLIRGGRLLAAKEKLMLGWVSTRKIQLLPGARDAVEYFRGAGLKVAVASSSPARELEIKLKRSGLESLFDAVVSSDDVRRGKPYPDIYLMAVRRLGLRPAECISFEDTQYGVRAAKSAGLACFAVPGEFSKKQDFSAADGAFTGLGKAVEFAKKKYGP